MKEFKDERAAIVNQIRSVHGFQINAAEEWGALSADVEKVYRGGVRECHIYMGVFGHLYSAATQEEYEEACKNPYRQKLIYLKRSRNIDPELAELIKVFQRRHKPYIFNDLWSLLPHVLHDLDSAVEEIANQNLERGVVAPTAQGEGERSVSWEAWKNKQVYLAALYEKDHDLTPESFHSLRNSLGQMGRKTTGRFQQIL